MVALQCKLWRNSSWRILGRSSARRFPVACRGCGRWRWRTQLNAFCAGLPEQLAEVLQGVDNIGHFLTSGCARLPCSLHRFTASSPRRRAALTALGGLHVAVNSLVRFSTFNLSAIQPLSVSSQPEGLLTAFRCDHCYSLTTLYRGAVRPALRHPNSAQNRIRKTRYAGPSDGT